MPHSSGFARLEFEAFYLVGRFPTFYGIIKLKKVSITGFNLSEGK